MNNGTGCSATSECARQQRCPRGETPPCFACQDISCNRDSDCLKVDQAGTHRSACASACDMRVQQLAYRSPLPRIPQGRPRRCALAAPNLARMTLPSTLRRSSHTPYPYSRPLVHPMTNQTPTSVSTLPRTSHCPAGMPRPLPFSRRSGSGKEGLTNAAAFFPMTHAFAMPAQVRPAVHAVAAVANGALPARLHRGQRLRCRQFLRHEPGNQEQLVRRGRRRV